MLSKKYKLILVLILLFHLAAGALAQNANTLTPAEIKQGWQLLFDGKTTNGWRSAYKTTFPDKGWKVENGELKGELSNGGESEDVGDIITLKKYRNFEMVFDWKLGKGGNSGVKYFIEERLPKPERGSASGYEYQLIDDADYMYMDKHLPQDLKTASIYDVIPASKPDVKINIWHTSKIVVNNNHIEHWLDGKNVMKTNRNTEAFRKGVADSKFKDYEGFATLPEGHILLQDHGTRIAFKNIKIREIKK